jgi:hypothetical protein
MSVIVLLSVFYLPPADAKSCLLHKKDCDVEIDVWGFIRPEVFAGKDFNFLNKNIPQDTIFYFRHTNDYFLDLIYGKETYGCPAVEFKTSVRNRAVWGSPSTIALTLPTTPRIAKIDAGEHNHAFPRLFFWMREVWVKLSLSELLNMDLSCDHSFTLGAFSFELGRGIALGAAYAIGQGPLGFYSDAMIDQFAFGFKYSGGFLKDVLTYDIYGALLQSRSNSFSETNRPVLANEIGHRDHPARGFGKDSYLIAGRLNWTVCDSDELGTLAFEPYAFYNDDPEQKIEFQADATSRLYSLGFAGEYIKGPFECGFDTAFNLGHQTVLPWDRNNIVIENYNGQLVAVNNHVKIANDNAFPQYNGLKAPNVPGSDAQKAIDAQNAPVAPLGNASLNGQLIPGAQALASLGYVQGPLDLVNSKYRFRNTKINKYRGWMFVTDASYWVYKNNVQVAVTGGYASGDQDPNFKHEGHDFKGFVGLQEVYAGKRVKSVFLLGTVGKVRRPGAQPPEAPYADKDFTSGYSGFTNLAFFGAGTTWKPSFCSSESRVVINPNVFAYWAPHPGDKFDPVTGRNIIGVLAGKYMGTEVNAFLSYYPLESVKCFAIGSVFVPGQFFTDHRGKPFNAEEKKALEAWQKLNAGLENPNFDTLPNIGNNIGYTINIGVEFAF